MIGQDIGLYFLIPLAIGELEKYILVEGDFYEGDLLKMVLMSDVNYWKKEKDNWKLICQLFENNKQKIEEFCYQNEEKNKWLVEFDKFKNFN
ncbi:MAG: contact-dependent growth inhibition system immunity protein [Polaribacter sp.]|uniref:contact-dependent growth inhibition system immunity protein n=1 Tax=Polaribacter sp. TaxID=1920175 RepID=UPI003263B87C